MLLRASYRDIWHIAYPIIIGSLAQNLIGLTDIVFLGRVGEVELGASGLISIYYLVLVMIGFSISRGGQIMIARRVGQKKDTEVGAITYNLLYVEMAASLMLFLFLLLLSPTVLHLFITSPDIYEASLAYLNTRCFGIFFSFFGFVVMALYTGIGRTKIIALITAILFISNIILNYSLIFGKFGLPTMGIAGAGLASTLAEIISTVVGVIYIFYDKGLKKYDLARIHPFNREVTQKLSELSMPLVLQYLIGLGGWFILFSLIESMGKRALAISTVLKNIYTFYSIPAWGFGAAVNSIVSNIIGQRKHAEAMIAINRTAMLSFVFTIVACLTLMLFPETMLYIFTSDPEVVRGAKPILFVLIAIILVGAVSVVVFNGMMGTGATRFSLFTETLGVICYLSYAYIVVKILNLGLTYVWGSEFLYWVILALLSWVYLQSGRWKKLKV